MIDTDQANMLPILSELSTKKLREIKIKYSCARGETWGHKLFKAADLILLKREGVVK